MLSSGWSTSRLTLHLRRCSQLPESLLLSFRVPALGEPSCRSERGGVHGRTPVYKTQGQSSQGPTKDRTIGFTYTLKDWTPGHPLTLLTASLGSVFSCGLKYSLEEL